MRLAFGGCARPLSVPAETQAAWRRARTSRAYYGVPAEVMARAQACHAGTLESAAEWFAAYRDAGAHHLVLRLARPGLTDYDETARQLLPRP